MDLLLIIDSLPKSKLKRQMEFCRNRKELEGFIDVLVDYSYYITTLL
jgi:hypothetical protein